MAKTARGKDAPESMTSVQQQLLNALKSIDRPGTFCTSGRVPAMLPGLEVEAVGPVALPLGKSQAAVLKKLARQAPYGNPPLQPADWRRDSKISCNCADCVELSRFLKDPNTQTLRFPLAKQRRQHLHNIIGGNKLDTTHVTVHCGSPHILVCTKTQDSYERALQAHQVDLDQLAKLRDMVDWHDSLA